MAKCSFCGEDLPIGGGKLYAKKDGVVLYFCSNKCEKNMLKLGRNPVNTQWTEAFRKMKGIKMSTKGKEAGKAEKK